MAAFPPGGITSPTFFPRGGGGEGGEGEGEGNAYKRGDGSLNFGPSFFNP